MEAVTYYVPGMSCSHCEEAVAAEVGQVAGVADVQVDLDAKTVAIRGEGLDDATLRAAIAEAGYDVA